MLFGRTDIELPIAGNLKALVKSIRFRLVGISVLIFGTAMVVLSVYLFQGIQRSQHSAFDVSLYNYAVDIANATDFTILGNLVVKRDVLVEENKVFPFSLGQSLVQIRTLDGLVIVSSKRLQGARLPLGDTAIEMLSRQDTAFETVDTSGILSDARSSRRYRMVNYVIRKPAMPPLILQIAAPMDTLEAERRQVLSLFLTLIPLAIGAAALVGLLTATRVLAPVTRIIRSAQRISAQQLSSRIPVPEETELKELALTLNELLSRLQQTFESQDQFIADASHQLKTPLAIVRGEIDVYLKTDRSQEEARTLIASVSQEVNQLAKMVDDLLLLARFDSAKPLTLSRVRIDEAALEAIAQLDKPARTRDIKIAFNVDDRAEGFEANGDADLLRQLFFNLLENAVKYSPDGGAIEVRLKTTAQKIQVQVEDHGPGIPSTDLPKIFDRFYRSSSSQHKIPGIGLGLAIAQRIARFHDGDLTAGSDPGHGTVFSFEIKKL